jgi:hypothetical protein
MATAGQEKGKAKTEVKPVIDDTIEAKVVDRKDANGNTVGSTVTYTAPVKEVNKDDTENEDENEDNFDLPIFENESQNEIGQSYTIPKTGLDLMFHNISYCVQNGEQDLFFANVFRVADPIGSRYKRPCIGGMELGMFQFTTRDRFGFISELHRLNNQSGGNFNVAIYRHDSTPLYVLIPPHGRYNTAPPVESNNQIGIINYGIPDPQTDEAAIAGNGSDNNAALLAHIEKSNERMEGLIREVIGKPREPSALEKAMEQKMLNDLLNPPEPKSNGMEQMMTTMFAMPIMVEKMAKRMFPEPPTPTEPNGFDRAAQILDLPPVAGLLGSIGNISEAWAISKMNAQGNNATDQQGQNQTQPEQNEMNSEMQDLMSDLIDELESDRPFNADNVFLQELKAEFPNQAGMIINTCKALEFPEVVKMLIGATANLNPNPFHQFWDIAETNKTNTIVWNERGNKVLARLQEFYGYVKTV